MMKAPKLTAAALAILVGAACEQGQSVTGVTEVAPSFSVTLPTTLHLGELVICKDGQSDGTYTFDVTGSNVTIPNANPTLSVTGGVGECQQVATSTSGTVSASEQADASGLTKIKQVDHYFVTGGDGPPVFVETLYPNAGDAVGPYVIGGDNGQLLVFINEDVPPPPPPPIACTYTQGYWKNHPADWPVSSLDLGTVTYDQAELLSILNAPVKGNGLISLAHQLIAAKLNGATAATAGIGASIAAADALIGSLEVPPVGSGYLDPSTTSSLTDALDDFNSGITGPGHCGD